MADWTKYFGPNVKLPASSQPTRSLRAFQISDPALDSEHVRVHSDAWCVTIETPGILARLFGRPRSVRLFEIPNPNVDRCLLLYRATMKPEGLNGQAYLEMWCRVQGREYFSRGVGFGQIASGTASWDTYETPFLLKKGETPDLIRLNIAVVGRGTILVKNVEVVSAPLQDSD